MLGHVESISRQGVTGWAADPNRPASETVVRIAVDDLRFGAKADEMREELRGTFPGATGTHGFSTASLHAFPLSPFVDHEIEVTFAATGALVPGGRAAIPRLGSAAGEAGKRRPVVVSSSGRAGTSLLMARLAGHPDILVAGEHPFEIKQIGYYAAAFNALTLPADRVRSTDPNTMLAKDKRFSIGSNPWAGDPALGPAFAQFWNERLPDALRHGFSAAIESFYDIVAAETGKTAARHFAEKIGSVDLAREGAAYFFGGADEIIMIRDPRDVVCSSKHFWKRAAEASVKTLRGQYAGFLRPRREAGARQHVVRYEDLVTAPDQTMAGVFRFLGLQPDGAARDARREAEIFAVHGTASSVQDSIGRWRRDLSDEEKDHANRELATLIERFGYPVQ